MSCDPSNDVECRMEVPLGARRPVEGRYPRPSSGYYFLFSAETFVCPLPGSHLPQISKRCPCEVDRANLCS